MFKAAARYFIFVRACAGACVPWLIGQLPSFACAINSALLDSWKAFVQKNC
jgi:hypothetical protein